MRDIYALVRKTFAGGVGPNGLFARGVELAETLIARRARPTGLLWPRPGPG